VKTSSGRSISRWSTRVGSNYPPPNHDTVRYGRGNNNFVAA
jgi:hypothetical protein